VPKTTVNKNDRLKAGQNDVRLAYHVRDVEAVAESEAMQKTSGNQLRAGIPAADRLHTSTALIGCESVGHGLYYCDWGPAQ
jgi:hypothetical protein